MSTMHAVLVNSDSSLAWAPTERPVAASTELLVRVHATAINRADLLQRAGKYPPPTGASNILGLELAGTVEALGSACTRFHEGDRVFGLVPGGSYAEYAVIDEAMAMAIPPGVSDSDAAAIPEAFLTAFQGLVWLGQLEAGSWALIHAGGSGVGTAAIQTARCLGAHAITTSAPEKTALCRALGADLALVGYDIAEHAPHILDLTGTDGLSVILDCLGPALLHHHLGLLGMDGRLVIIGLMHGSSVPESDLRAVLRKRISIVGTTLRNRPREYQRRLTAAFLDWAAPFLADRTLRPVVSHHFHITEVTEAHRIMEQRANAGKIVLTFQ